jgi:hypothetical protein
MKDSSSVGSTTVQVYRIKRTHTPGSEQQQQQTAAPGAADTPPLFRPYDALQLASQHEQWHDEKLEKCYKLVRTQHWHWQLTDGCSEPAFCLKSSSV